MTSPAHELQVLLYNTLKDDTGVKALVDGVHDTVPDSPFGVKEAYISFGAMDMAPDEADCIDGEEHTVQIDVWSRRVGQPHCKNICHAVKKALHKRALQLPNHTLADIELILERVFRDPDGVTIHGAMQFRVAIEVNE